MEDLLTEYKSKIKIAKQYRDAVKDESNPNWIKFNTAIICFNEIILDLERALAKTA